MKHGRLIKRLLALIALVVAGYFLWPMLKEIGAAGKLFARAAWYWLPVAIAIQAISFIFLTWLNRLALNPFTGTIRSIRLAGVLTAMAFVETAFPSVGASGAVLRVRLLGKHGRYTAEGSTFSYMLESFYLTLARVSLVLLGVVYLLKGQQISLGMLVNLGLAAVLGVIVVYRGWKLLSDPVRSQVWLDRLARISNRFFGRFYHFDRIRMGQRLHDFQASLVYLRKIPAWKFWLAAYGRIGLDIGTLWVCFVVFQYSVSAGTLLTGYGLTLLLSGLASLPGGIGLTEATVPAVFAGLGVPEPVALTAGLTYRLIAFWLLRLVGFVNWQILEETGG